MHETGAAVYRMLGSTRCVAKRPVAFELAAQKKFKELTKGFPDEHLEEIQPEEQKESSAKESH